VTARASADDPEVLGVLVESPATASGDPVLQAARLVGAMTMLRRSGFELILLEVGAAAPIVKRSRRRPWRRPEWREER